MKRTMTKVWIIKYALSRGLYEADLEINENGYGYPAGTYYGFSPRDYRMTRDEAVAAACLMQRKKIKSLENQLAAMKAKTF